MGRDPEDGEFWEPKTLHKYLYAGGDPVDAWDPTGRDFLEYLVLAYHNMAEALVYGSSMRDCINDAFKGESALLDAANAGYGAQGSGLRLAIELGQCVGEATRDLARGIPWSFVANHL
jgi:hypothetical protein